MLYAKYIVLWKMLHTYHNHRKDAKRYLGRKISVCIDA